MRRSILLVIFFFIYSLTFAHSGKARYHTIIDTDCAADDLRAISMILASPEFEVLAITTSDGILHANEGYLKVCSLLNDFGHQGIPVAYGESNKSKKPECHEMNISVSWGNSDKIEIPNKAGAKELIRKSIIGEDEKVLIVCLGPLTNIIDIVSDKALIPQIEKIVWYCDDYSEGKGFNFVMDTKAAKEFQNSEIEKLVLSNNDSEDFIVGNDYFKLLDSQNNKYAGKIVSTHVNQNYSKAIAKGSLKFWDDLLPVYLLYDQYFDVVNQDENTILVSPKSDNIKDIKSCFFEILDSKTSKECKVFKTFPLDESLYADDVAKNMSDIIKKHGLLEWRAGVITNELHGHLGIYAIVGVKMGTRVREYFNIGVDDIHITSFAGNHPPTSCMNDGLQVSVGATIGHGLITVSDEEFKRPEAIFQFKNQKIKLRLKDQYWNQIRNDVKYAIAQHGNLTPDYWILIREYAITYWAEFDRMEMFEIEKL